LGGARAVRLISHFWWIPHGEWIAGDFPFPHKRAGEQNRIHARTAAIQGIIGAGLIIAAFAMLVQSSSVRGIRLLLAPLLQFRDSRWKWRGIYSRSSSEVLSFSGGIRAFFAADHCVPLLPLQQTGLVLFILVIVQVFIGIALKVFNRTAIHRKSPGIAGHPIQNLVHVLLGVRSLFFDIPVANH
jgi:hypothetical protein